MEVKWYNTNTKIRIFNSKVILMLLNCPETWNTTKRFEQKLASFQTRCLRKLNIKWKEFITKEEVQKRANQSIEQTMEICWSCL